MREDKRPFKPEAKKKIEERGNIKVMKPSIVKRCIKLLFFPKKEKFQMGSDTGA